MAQLGKRLPCEALVVNPGQNAGVGVGMQESDGVPLSQTLGHVKKAMQGSDEVWITPTITSRSTASSCPLSSSTDVPHRSPDLVDMDEIMAALVLTSLSCSPLVPSPPPRETGSARGDLSDSSSSLRYWSPGGPSPPSSSAPPAHQVWNMEPELGDEPAPHKRKAAPRRSRSVSAGEQWLQANSAPHRPYQCCLSPPAGSYNTSRRLRGEAKKCRKVYGVGRRALWCTACRWKKACQRFQH